VLINRRSGGVSNHFKLRGAIHRGQKAIDSRHRHVPQLRFAALPALDDWQRPYRAAAHSTVHSASLLKRPFSSRHQTSVITFEVRRNESMEDEFGNFRSQTGNSGGICPVDMFR
jgi:hypothetical protein